ncbi:hypothetical protein IQ266_13520 [filamentous cyanobacterium LEGE 11480]|uniref:Lipoprotein n=1 Tax=Romeriopsis navalis LEGE 11480 TaxID=2777977 RepID=A0A928Z2U2_9CYAN|nr:outer membrane protein assembly factor BamE [Romeriopsis navalis]MBE9030751.1 hypothetical protein [Romeriopsis navalis LEGE 11480]
MSWKRLAGLILSLGLLGPSLGCTHLAVDAIEQAVIQAENSKAPRRDRRRDGPSATRRQAERRKSRQRRQASHPQFDQVKRGMTYDQVVALLGSPERKQGQYAWDTMEGKITVAFGVNDRAQYSRAESTVSQDLKRQVRELVRARANYNTIAANLGGDAATLVSARAVWVLPKGEANISFRNNQVIGKRWSRQAT